MSDYFLSPYRYSDQVSLHWKHPGITVSQDGITELFADSTLSGLDFAIMMILYRLHYAGRRTIEEELEGFSVRKPKNLKRTLAHLIKEGILSGFASVIRNADANIRFYCLTEPAVLYMSEHGGQTDFSYKKNVSVRDMCAILAYNQLALSMAPTFGEKRIIKNKRQYCLYGMNGELVIDGYIELMKDEQIECLYIHVVRGESHWREHTYDFYSRLSYYTEGISNATVLFLCENSEQVLALSNYMDEKNTVAHPKRYYTYDTLIFTEQLSQRIIAWDGSSMIYGSLIL